MRAIQTLAFNTIKALIRKKDFYVFLIMLTVLFVFLYLQRFAGVEEISRYLKDIGFYVLWIFSLIIAVSFSAKQIPQEIKERTMVPLLTKPVSRWQLLLGRFAGSVLAVSLAFTVFYGLYMLVIVMKGEAIYWALFAQAYVLGICFFALVCAVSMYLSLRLTYSAAVTVSLIIYFCVIWFIDPLSGMMLSSEGIISVLLSVLYYLIPHYEFFDLHVRIVHSWEALPAWVFGGIILYAVIYTTIVLQLSYRKIKDRIF
jgi:ABC-type transport system involved in multi-copper enzyme maturation permease subunit